MRYNTVMSEQLTLEGLVSSPAPKEKKEPVKKPKTAMLDADMQARVQKLLDEKAARYLEKVELSTDTKMVPLVNVSTRETVIIEKVSMEEPPVAAPEPEVLSVSDLNKNIKKLLEKSFPIIWVKGEISNFKVPGSGHFYFTLKDETAQIKAVMFRGYAQALKFKPEDGMEVLVRCKVTVYEPRGDYQLFCEVMEPVGFGALQIAFEKLKAQLQKEGLFEMARKKPIPAFPQRIAIVTSPTGAAIRDMLHVLDRRFGGGLDITLIPASVQGEKAPAEIAQAVNWVSKVGTKRFDVLIVGRGGGSLEDLWSFNTELVARAVAQCSVPTISAVGHEVDFTICDFVADLRAPTPSAAAEVVVKNKADLSERIRLLEKSLKHQVSKKIQIAQTLTHNYTRRLVDPKRKLQDLFIRCDEWTDRLVKSVARFVEDCSTQVRFITERLESPMIQILQHNQSQFAKAAALLNGLSPLAVLDRGYSIVKSGDQIVKDAETVKKGDKIEVKLAKGQLKAEVL